MAGILEGQCGVITGASGGLGRAMCEAFRNAGARVAALDLDEKGAAQLAQQLGNGAMAVGADITDEGSVRRGFETVLQAFGRLDFLINNAGVRYEKSFLEHDLASWKRTLDVNITGSFLCAQAACRVMVDRGGGSIVNIASITGFSAFRTRPAYVVSKHGVIGLTKAIAFELGGQGIRCNAIAPGIVETPLTAHYFKQGALASLIEENTPIRRWATPNEIADPAVFLCSKAAGFVQGTTLVVDGGWLSGKGY